MHRCGHCGGNIMTEYAVVGYDREGWPRVEQEQTCLWCGRAARQMRVIRATRNPAMRDLAERWLAGEATLLVKP